MILVMRVLIVLMFACFPVRAEEEMEFDIDMDTRLVCDTQKQVERFVALFTGDVGAALHAVNNEQDNPTAFDVASVAYVPGDEMADAKGPCGHFRVVRILLIGVLTEDHGFCSRCPRPISRCSRREKISAVCQDASMPTSRCGQRSARLTSNHRSAR